MRQKPVLLRLLSAPEGRAPSVGEDAQALVRTAGRHGLSGVVLHRLKGAGQQLPPEAQKRLESDARAVAAQALRVRQLLFRALESLEGAGLKPVALKGYALGARLYPSPLLRPASDVDLLVRREEMERAEAALLGMGLTRYGDSALERYQRAHHHHVNFRGLGSMVELHFRLTGSFASSLEWEDLGPLVATTLDGREVQVLPPADELTYLSVHAAEHLFLRLSWLYDLKRLVETVPGLDWERVVSLGRRSGYASPLWCALRAAREAFDAAVPDEVLRALSPVAPRARVLAALFSPERLADAPLAGHKYQEAAVRTVLVASPVDAGRYVLHHGARVARRRLSERLPSLTPWHWRG